jgi:hypothetical protein
MKYFLAMALLLISFNSYAELHKWVDANGNVHYSDTPPPPGVKVETIRTHVSPGNPSKFEKSFTEQAADINKANKKMEEAAKSEADKQKEAQAKQQSCEEARNRLMTLKTAPRIATVNDKGERTIMDDASRQKQIEQANTAVSKYCN